MGATYSPMAAMPAETELLTSRQVSRAIWFFLALGLVARSVRFLVKFPLWEDECFLCYSYIGRGYLDLLGPLPYHQVSPVLFMWLELTIVKLLGFAELPLRLMPFLFSVGSLFLFRHLATRLLKGTALVLAVAVFAVAFPCVRYAGEAKQYASDLFVALLLLTLAVEWWRRPEKNLWLWLLTALVPIGIGLSYPAVFPAGGVSLFVAYVLWTNPPPQGGRGLLKRGWVPWSAYNLALLGGFACMMLTAQGQSGAELAWMKKYWDWAFPPLSHPLKLPVWFLATHFGEYLAYPVPWSGAVTFPCCVVGAVTAWRLRRFGFVVLCLAPLALHLIAASLHRYPYGDHLKFSLPQAPAICLLSGLGGAGFLAWLRTRRYRVDWALRTWLVILALPALLVIARDVCYPYKIASDQRARAFAEWFWIDAQFQGEVVCAKTDLGLDFSCVGTKELSWSAMYYCNQKIYSPRHACGAPPDWSRVSFENPLRCLVYRETKHGFNQSAFDRWLEEMQTHYDVIGRDTYCFPRYGNGASKLVTVDYLEVCRFIPKVLHSEHGRSEPAKLQLVGYVEPVTPPKTKRE